MDLPKRYEHFVIANSTNKLTAKREEHNVLITLRVMFRQFQNGKSFLAVRLSGSYISFQGQSDYSLCKLQGKVR